MRKIIICKNCGEEKQEAAKGLCMNCYKKQNIKICKECGELKSHYGKGLCVTCYQRQNLKICKMCGELRPHKSFGLCNTCYKHKMGICKPFSENKECSSYLGLLIEKLLVKRFKNAEQMPMGNRGFDFKCGKGYKIDAKASVIQKNNNNFKFMIRKNKIADYFCCVGIDNRKNANIINAWLIPSDAISKRGKKVNELISLSIAISQMDYWKRFEMDINILDTCCATMKND